MRRHGVLLLPKGDIENSLAFDGERRRLVGSPEHGVAKETCEIVVECVPESAIDVAREVGDATFAYAAQDHSGLTLRCVGAWEDLFHGEVGVGGYDLQGLSSVVCRCDGDLVGGVNDAWSVLEVFEERVHAAGGL